MINQECSITEFEFSVKEARNSQCWKMLQVPEMTNKDKWKKKKQKKKELSLQKWRLKLNAMELRLLTFFPIAGV